MEMYWTLRHYDSGVHLRGARRDGGHSVTLAADMLGNIRTQTMRAFTAKEMESILGQDAVMAKPQAGRRSDQTG